MKELESAVRSYEFAIGTASDSEVAGLDCIVPPAKKEAHEAFKAAAIRLIKLAEKIEYLDSLTS